MKTYFRDDETGLYVGRNAEWIYIGNDLNGEVSEQFTIMDYELDDVIKALQKIKAEVDKEEQLTAEKQRLEEWNSGEGIKDYPRLPRSVVMSLSRGS